MARNGWSASIGIHGRHSPDYASSARLVVATTSPYAGSRPVLTVRILPSKVYEVDMTCPPFALLHCDSTPGNAMARAAYSPRQGGSFALPTSPSFKIFRNTPIGPLGAPSYFHHLNLLLVALEHLCVIILYFVGLFKSSRRDFDKTNLKVL